MRLELRQVDLNQRVVFAALVFMELVTESPGKFADLLTFRRSQVVVHSLVEWENRSRSTDLSTHVADGSHPGTRKRFDARSVVLDDGAGATFDCEDTSNFEDDV